MPVDRSRRSRFELVDGLLQAPGPANPDVGNPSGSQRRSAVVTICAVLLAVAAIVVPGRSRDGQIPPPAPSPTAASSPADQPSNGCDLADAGCRIVQAERWRDRTAAVLRDRLDPKNAYFTGYSYSQTSRYNTGPRLNALGLEIYRQQDGATEVFVQIARTPADAVRCGTITHHRCTSQQFMDGDTFLLSDSTTASAGIEVQHVPTGTYVITLVARNTTVGRPLALTIGDLVEVAQDPRLRPPPD